MPQNADAIASRGQSAIRTTPAEFERRAQSNNQLYEQLVAAGYCMDDVLRVRNAYTLAGELFAAQMRPDGRPFVCHLVGVAAILAMVDASAETIVTGLLHSAYTHGDFGFGPGQPSRNRRRKLCDEVGPAVERLVALYSSRPFNPSTVAKWTTDLPSLDADERVVVLIRLADTLEDALDHGLLMSQKQENPNRSVPVEQLVALAERLSQPELAAALSRAMQQNDSPKLASLRTGHSGSYVVCPASWRQKLFPRIVRRLRQIRAMHRP